MISTDCVTQARVRELARQTIGDTPIAIVIVKNAQTPDSAPQSHYHFR